MVCFLNIWTRRLQEKGFLVPIDLHLHPADVPGSSLPELLLNVVGV